MSFNLIDLIKEPLTDQIMKQLGGVLGGSVQQNNNAISSAIPGILSGLLNAGTSNQRTADAMLGTLNNHDDGILDNLGSLLGNSQQSSSMMDLGTKALGSLLGGGGLGSLVSSVAGFSGAGKGPVKSMLGLLAPVIFGVIKRKLLGSGGLSAGNLLNLLKGQKDNIGAAMPAGFNDQLNSSGFFKNFVADTTREAQHTTREVQYAEKRKGKSFFGKLVLPILILGGLLLAYNYFMKDRTREATRTTSEVVSTTPRAAQLTVNPVQELNGIFSSLTSSLGGVTDVDSAKAVLPNITASTDKLANLAGMLNQMSEGQRASAIDTVSAVIPKLQALLNKLEAIPGVGNIIKPAIQGLVEKLALFK